MKIASRDLELFWFTDFALPYLSTSRPSVPAYRVGEALQHGRQSWPAGAQYHHAANGHELTVFQPEIRETLIQDVGRGHAEFAVIVKHPVILLAYRFGETGVWSDIPYCWHMQPPNVRVLPPPSFSPESRALLWINLVGANDGIIHAQRGVTLAPAFTQVLHEAIAKQAQARFQAIQCIKALNELLIAYPSTASRLPLARSRTAANQ